MTDADRDQLIIALTAFEEASDQGQDGIRAQIHSVVNRHAAGKWYSRKTLSGTCLLAYAYSAWNTTDQNRERAVETPMSDVVMETCMTEALWAMSGVSKDPTDGATHYFVAGTPAPSWSDPATGSVFTVQIGQHRFYKSVA